MTGDEDSLYHKPEQHLVAVPDINLQRGGADFGSGNGLGVAVNVGTPYVGDIYDTKTRAAEP